MDPLEQMEVRQMRVEKWVSGKLVSAQEDAMRRTLYLPSEMMLMLRVAGFREISIRSDYTDAPATPDSQELIFTAIK